MRPTYGVPQDDGSRRSHQCPPSHHEMALMPEYAQASARAPRPSQPLTGSPMSSAPVSPYHQQGSTMPLAAPATYSPCHLVPFASMGGEVPTHGRTIARMGRWHPCLLPQRRHRHRQAWLILHRQLGPIPPTHTEPWGDSRRVNGTLACYHRGGNTITKLGPSFLADSVFSHPPSTNNGGERRLGGRPCFALQSPAFGICHVYKPRIC